MLVLFDLDKTLIDVDYHYTHDGIVDAIRSAIKRGHVIGLNSDTPLAILHNWYHELGMNGPIVAERGAVVHIPGDPSMTFATGTSPSEEFLALRDRVVRRLTQGGEVEAIFGDPTGIIRTRRFLTNARRSVLLVSALRTHSLDFAARVVDSADYQFDTILLKNVEEVTRAELVASPLTVAVNWDLNDEYAILILHASASCKGAGVAALLARISVDEAVMVGDGIVDNLQLSNVQQWAVGNAHPSYKAVCSHVASGTFTSGAIELLDTLP